MAPIISSSADFNPHMTLQKPSPDLPAPDPDAHARSLELCDQIRTEIERNGGRISFERFMELALYAPGLGYYMSAMAKFGAAGDFVTAPELSDLFGACVARQCAQVLRHLGGGDVLEVGGGSGRLAVQVMRELEMLGCLPERYLILDLSGSLRARQEQTLTDELAHLRGRVQWLDRLPEQPLRGVVLANEVLDAMPVQRFVMRADELKLQTVAAEKDRFVWREEGAPAELARDIRQRLPAGDTVAGYTSEVNPRAEGWVGSMADVLATGLVLVIDYGFPAAEYYHPQRTGGTLMCHYRHRSHDDPLVLVGLQDITAHVDFTAIAEAAHASGLSVLGYTNQASFLIATGLLDLMQDRAGDDAKLQLELGQQVKKLTLPSEMGELFKVIAFGKRFDEPLLGFDLHDQRGKL